MQRPISIVIFLIFAFTFQGKSQCMQVETSDCFCNAPLIEPCIIATDSTYCLYMQSFQTEAAVFPACPDNVLNNPHWFAFYGDGNTMVIRFEPSNCTQIGAPPESGIQLGIYEVINDVPVVDLCRQCLNYIDDVDPVFLTCNCVENPLLTNFETKKGSKYVVVVDGCAGSACDIMIEVIASGPSDNLPPDCGRTHMSGLVYMDNNENGVRDSTESIIPYINIYADSDLETIIMRSDVNGTFATTLGESTYYVGPDTIGCYVLPGGPIELSLDSLPGDTINLELGLVPFNTEPGYAVYSHFGWPRCNEAVPFWVNVQNIGCVVTNAFLEVELDSALILEEIHPQPDSVSGNTVYFEVSNFNPFQELFIRVVSIFPPTPGEEVTAITKFYSVDSAGSKTLVEEVLTTTVVNCSFDPNDKLVSPDRSAFAGEAYTLFDEELEYTIRFQNTGNDTAYHVRIEDVIDDGLDISTLRPLASSHDFEYIIYADRTVEFVFENILLPDSNANQALSNGFVSFSIRANGLLNEMDSVFNTANIYFDANAPITTNTVKNIFVSTFDADSDGFEFWNECDDDNDMVNPDATEIANNGLDDDCDGFELVPTNELYELGISIFPNPMSDEFRISNENKHEGDFTIYDLNGRQVMNGRLNNTYRVDVSVLDAGIYLIRVSIDTGKGVYAQRIVVQK